jgi:hypothetical protein
VREIKSEGDQMTTTRRESYRPQHTPKLRHSGQAQRRSGTHAVDGGEANWVRKKAPK